MLEFFVCFWVVTVETFKLPLVSYPVGEVFDNFLLSDVEDFSANVCKTAIVLPKILIVLLLAASKVCLRAWLCKDTCKVAIESFLQVAPAGDRSRPQLVKPCKWHWFHRHGEVQRLDVVASTR